MERQLEVKGSSAEQSSSCCYELNERDKHESSVKWMPSKMRITRKFMCSDQNTVRRVRRRRRRHLQIQDDRKEKGNTDRSSFGSGNNGGISRVCSDCNTTRTPLWRSGPHGPKSLCNACGIKQRKAREATSAATVLSGKLQPVVAIKPGTSKELKVDCNVPFKKRCRFITTAETAHQRKLSFEDIAVSLNKSLLSINRVFPQDEKEAAILLMALSCGIVCSL